MTVPLDQTRRRLDTQALVVGYAMSRMDRMYLRVREISTWQAAFQEAAIALDKPRATFKNLRDEFDPVHGNQRRGWRGRPLRDDRQRVLGDMAGVSDAALMALVERILALDSMADPSRPVANVAERLLTGRTAERFFLANSQNLVGVSAASLIDLRDAAMGYDFGVTDAPQRAFEVKGLKARRGQILFTDREWQEAARRGEQYAVVVVGNLEATPIAKVIYDPHRRIDAALRLQQTIQAGWIATVGLT